MEAVLPMWDRWDRWDRWERPRPGAATEFTTTDPAEAHVYLQDTYVPSSMRISGSTDGFRMRAAYHDAGDFAVSSMSHTMAVEHRAEPLGYVLVGRLLLGEMERETDGEVLRAGTEDVFLVARPDRPYRTAWSTMRLQMLRIELPHDARQIRFGTLQPRSADAAQRLKRAINFARSAVLAKPEALASPLVVSRTTRLLTSAVLEAFEGESPRPADRPGGVSSRAVRRAIAYIDAHAHADIGLAEIAAAARMAPGTTERAFRRHVGSTPLGYLRRVRLERAHRDLVAADPDGGETVVTVRLRWGFLDARGFVESYREAYGRSPQETLQN